VLIDLVLLRDRLIEFVIFLPGPRYIAEIAQTESRLTQARASDQSFYGDRVEALSFVLRAPAKLRVQSGWNVSQGVLHALSIGDAGT
jgi:hypothetical protein